MGRNHSRGITVALIFLILCAQVFAAGTVYGQIEDISMWLDKTQFVPGETIVVHFTAPEGFPADAWIGLMPAGIPHDYEVIYDQYDVRSDTIQYRYLSGKTSGVLTFSAPPKPGMYDFRMYEGESGGVEIGSMSLFIVTP
jgi:hypothetical protein